LGLVWLRRGDRTQAIEHFERALKSDPDLASARRNLALVWQTPPSRN
jgi:Tfp pilus assembly protein PilF